MGLLATIEKRATLENPNTSLANPSAWLLEAFGAQQTHAGVRMSREKMLQSSAVWAAHRVITNVIAIPSLPVYRRLDRGRERAPDHPLARLLDLSPNPEIGSITFRRMAQGHLLMYGNFFAEKEFNAGGAVVALWPLLPDRTKAERRNGRRVIITEVDGRDMVLPADSVFHVLGENTWQGMNGRGLVTYARESLGLSSAAEEFGARHFGSGAHMSGALKHPAKLSKEAQKRLRDKVEATYGGLSNAHRVAILEEGMDWVQMSVAPDDSQFIETRKFQLTEIARWFGVPPHMIADLERATFSNIESQQIAFYVQGALPWYRTWEEAIQIQLMPERDMSTFYAEFLHEELLRADSAARAAFYKELYMMGAITGNEIRERENLNPIDGGDEAYVPVNMVPVRLVDSVFSASEATPFEESTKSLPTESRAARSVGSRRRIQQAQATVMQEIASRITKREVKAMRRLVRKTLGQRDLTDFKAEVEKFYESLPAIVRASFFPTFLAFMELVAHEIGQELEKASELTIQLRAFVTRYAEAFAERWVRKSLNQIRQLIRDVPDGEEAEAIVTRMDGWEQSRPEKVAQVESVRAGSAFARTVYVGLGVVSLRWVAFGENCPYCTRLNGKVVGVQESFLSKGDLLPGAEGDDPIRARGTVRHPPIHRGCDCTIGVGT